VPAQTVVAVAVILMPGVTAGFTGTIKGSEDTLWGEAQAALLVMMQLTASLSAGT